jgi:hypothetical protein
MSDAHAREASRQQQLLRALRREPGADVALQPWLRGAAADAALGLAAYRANARAHAERALAAAYPTLAALVGDDSFAALARDCWQRHAPRRGDLAEWGAELPAFIADQESLAGEPYLADSARLDWCVHQALRAADAPSAAPALEALAHTDLAQLVLQLPPGSALLASAWPVASIWRAHRQADAQRFDAARAALQAGRGESVFVVRHGLAVRVHALDTDDAAFTRALLAAAPLSAALDAAGPGFAFDRWLARALAERWLAHIAVTHP